MMGEIGVAGKELVEVEVKTFVDLLDLDFPLALDNYQRPYVWDQGKIEQLTEDLHEYQQGIVDQSPNYYMGTLLLHRNKGKNKLFVIDGQQRLTSLSVLRHVLGDKLPASPDFNYRSELSVKNIKHAQTVFGDLKDKLPTKEIFGQLSFTVIIVENEDLAFTFFDTQNNRGVPLATTDLLKAFHLRSIPDEPLQRHCAKRWEGMQVQRYTSEKSNDFAPELFHYYLWRSRNWKGQRLIERESRDDVLATFQHQSIPCNTRQASDVPLYPGINNRLAATLSLLPSDEYQLSLNTMQISSNPSALPFSLRQPIHQGVGFFLYAQKYVELLNGLLHGEIMGVEVRAFREFHGQVMSKTSHYLRELFNLAVLMYVDQFGEKGLLRFSLCLDHVLGSIRLNKKYIFKEAPLKYLKESGHNLLDVIAGAYRAEEVIDFLMADTNAKAVYESLYSSSEPVVEIGKGVQGQYLNAVCDYYGRGSLDAKQHWISEKILGEKLRDAEVMNEG